MTTRLLLPTQPVTQKGDRPSRDLVEIIQRLVAAVNAGGGGGGATDLGYVQATRLLTSSTGGDVTLPLATALLAGLMSATDKAKLDGTTVARGLATVTVPNKRFEWSQLVTATGVTPASIVLVSIAAHDDADENDAEMLDIAAMSAAAGTDQITIEMSFITPVAGVVKLNWMAA